MRGAHVKRAHCSKRTGVRGTAVAAYRVAARLHHTQTMGSSPRDPLASPAQGPTHPSQRSSRQLNIHGTPSWAQEYVGQGLHTSRKTVTRCCAWSPTMLPPPFNGTHNTRGGYNCTLAAAPLSKQGETKGKKAHSLALPVRCLQAGRAAKPPPTPWLKPTPAALKTRPCA